MSPAVDRISNLPEKPSEIIFMHLPLRDAVRTSILSHYWRYRWTKLPQLVFDENIVSYPEGKAHKMYDEKLVKIVNQVLLVHHGPIHKFKLSINSQRGADIGRWLFLLARNGINELSLEMTGDGCYKLPSCFYLCEELTDLRLFGCTLTVPPSVKGFGRLRALELHDVIFPNSELEMLISLCPLIQILVLRGISGCHTLNLRAMKLIDLAVDVDFKCFRFEYTPCLISLEINIGFDEFVKIGVACKLSQVFGSLPKLKKLHLAGDSLWVMAYIDTDKLPPARHLKCLSIELKPFTWLHFSFVRRIIRSSPSLRKLNISLSGMAPLVTKLIKNHWKREELKFDEDLKFGGLLMSQLKVLEVTNFVGTVLELKFVEFALNYSPVLEKVQIELKQCFRSSALDILTKITHFRRLSSRAEVVFRVL